MGNILDAYQVVLGTVANIAAFSWRENSTGPMSLYAGYAGVVVSFVLAFYVFPAPSMLQGLVDIGASYLAAVGFWQVWMAHMDTVKEDYLDFNNLEVMRDMEAGAYRKRPESVGALSGAGTT